MRQPIIPEPINIESPNYVEGHWDYARRCADLELALNSTLERIQEWNMDSDPQGWWHERTHLIAMYNAIVSNP